jgi:epoxyqueuosine reductase
MTPSLTERVKDRAQALGFDLVGVCRPEPSAEGASAYQAWLAEGHAGEMGYLGRPDRVTRTLDPRANLPTVRSILAVGKNYFTGDLAPEIARDPSRGLFASYAWGQDYHSVMTPRLDALRAWLAETLGREVAARVYVDTGPVLERDAAQRAGLGFTGKNTMLIHPRWGAWLFLGEILLDVELEPDAPDPRGTCGRCTRCLVACPTDAFPAPYVLDARRCISYLTIELKGPIPPALRPGIGNRIFGCDICNEVCPWNKRFARRTEDPELQPDPERIAPPLLDLLALDDAGFRRRFAGTAVERTRRRGLLRNVCVALGNWGAPEAAMPLARALADAEPLIRGHAAWALGRIGGGTARAALDAARTREPEDWVLGEIRSAIEASGARSG